MTLELFRIPGDEDLDADASVASVRGGGGFSIPGEDLDADPVLADMESDLAAVESALKANSTATIIGRGVGFLGSNIVCYESP